MPGVQRAPARVRLWEKAGRPVVGSRPFGCLQHRCFHRRKRGVSLPDGRRRTRKAPFPATRLPVARRRPKTPAAPVQTGRGPRTPRDRSRPHPLRPTGWRSISSEIAGARSPAPSLDRWRSRNAIPTPCRATATSGRGPGRTTTICIRPTATAPASAVSTAISRWAA